MTEAEAADLALKFAQYDLNDDNRLDASEVRAMAGQLGIELSSEEAAIAIQVGGLCAAAAGAGAGGARRAGGVTRRAAVRPRRGARGGGASGPRGLSGRALSESPHRACAGHPTPPPSARPRVPPSRPPSHTSPAQTPNRPNPAPPLPPGHGPQL